MRSLEWQARIGVVVGNIGLVMHYKKFPESNIGDLLVVLRIVMKQQRQSQQFMYFGRRQKVDEQQADDDLSFHNYKYRIKFPTDHTDLNAQIAQIGTSLINRFFPFRRKS